MYNREGTEYPDSRIPPASLAINPDIPISETTGISLSEMNR
jgi:hypothetical protein